MMPGFAFPKRLLFWGARLAHSSGPTPGAQTSAVESPVLVEDMEEDVAYEETLQEYIQHSGGRSANLQPSHRLSPLGKDIMRAVMMHRLAPQLSAAGFEGDVAYLRAVIEAVPLPREREELRQALSTCLGMAAFRPPSEEELLP